MAALTSKEELKSYIFRQLGNGVHNVELTDEQLEDSIENAIGYFEREVDGGTEDRVYVLELFPDSQEYILDDEVMGIEEIIKSSRSSMNDLTSPETQYKISASDAIASGTSNGISGFVTNMQYLEMINDTLGGGVIPFTFNPVSKKLSIHQKIQSETVVVMYVLWSTRDIREMWNNNFIKEYSSALAMRQWGINMSKYNGAQLVGGMELNGDGMLQLADSEIVRLREELLDKETSPLGIFVG